MKTILITCLILLIGLNCYADKYDKIESQVRKYERIAESLNQIKAKGDELHSRGILIGLFVQSSQSHFLGYKITTKTDHAKKGSQKLPFW